MPVSHDPTYPLYPVAAFIGFVVSIIPLQWHIQAWNAGTCAFMIWTGLACLNGFVNSLVWRGNVFNHSPIWCDISSKFMIGVSVAIPASTLCITRRLYSIATVRTVSITPQDKRRMVLIDLLIAVGIPVVIMTLHYIVQGHRFDILEDVGCYPTIYNTLPAYFIFFMWPLVLGAASFAYSGLTLRAFWLRRAQFAQLISLSSGMSPSRYLRLTILSLTDMLFTVPLGAFMIYQGTKGVGLQPWISWEETHYNFSRVALIPSSRWRQNPDFQLAVEFTRWLPIFSALTFFLLFGFATEARKRYTIIYHTLSKLSSRRSPSEKPAAKKSSWIKPLKLGNPSCSVIPPPPYPHDSKPPQESSPISSHDLETGLSGCDSSSHYLSPVDIHLALSHNLMGRSRNDLASFSTSSLNSTVVATPFPSNKRKPTSKSSQSASSLRSITSRDRFYISNEPRPRSRSPSPVPFVNTVPSLPLVSTSAFAPSHDHPQGFVDGIFVTVHTFTSASATSRP